MCDVLALSLLSTTVDAVTGAMWEYDKVTTLECPNIYAIIWNDMFTLIELSSILLFVILLTGCTRKIEITQITDKITIQIAK